MEYVSSLEQLKSNKINTVLFYFQYKNKIKQSSFEKHKEFLLNEIKYYCKFDKCQARDVYDIIVDVIKIIEKYDVNQYNKCSLCHYEKVHSIEYDKTISIDNKPIIFMSPGMAVNHVSFYVCQHFLIETIKCLQTNDQFSIVFDFANYKLYHALSNVSVAYNLSNIISICFTDHLHKIYIIDPPSYISPLVVMIKKTFYNSIFTRIIQLSKKEYLETIKRVNH